MTVIFLFVLLALLCDGDMVDAALLSLFILFIVALIG